MLSDARRRKIREQCSLAWLSGMPRAAVKFRRGTSAEQLEALRIRDETYLYCQGLWLVGQVALAEEKKP